MSAPVVPSDSTRIMVALARPHGGLPASPEFHPAWADAERVAHRAWLVVSREVITFLERRDAASARVAKVLRSDGARGRVALMCGRGVQRHRSGIHVRLTRDLTGVAPALVDDQGGRIAHQGSGHLPGYPMGPRLRAQCTVCGRSYDQTPAWWLGEAIRAVIRDHRDGDVFSIS